MEKVSLQLAKIVGTSTERGWSQVHTFLPEEKEKLASRGQLLAVISLAGLSEGVEAVAAGREVISRLHEEYYGNLEGGAFDRLATAVKKVVAEVELEARSEQSLSKVFLKATQPKTKGDSAKDQRRLGQKLEIEIGAAAVVGDVLYLAIAGKGQVVLQRDSQMGVILQGLPKKEDLAKSQKSEEVATASGYLKDGDLFLLGTGKFFQTVAIGVLKAALATGSPTEATEALAPIIHGRPEDGTIAAVIGKIKKREEEKKFVSVSAGVSEQEPFKQKLESGQRQIDQKPEKRKVFEVFITSVKTRITKLLVYLQKRLREQTIYLKHERYKKSEKPRRSKKTVFTVTLVLILLLGLSVALGARQKKHLKLEKGLANLFKEARQKKEEGEALLDLNPLRARELLLEAQNLSQQIKTEGLKTAEFEKFENELSQALSQVLKEHQTEVEVFFDLELIKQEAKGDDWAVSGGKMMILDKEKPLVYELEIGDKKSAISAGGKDLEGASQVAAFLPKIFILTKKGIVEIDRLTKKERLVVEVDEEWGEIVDFQAFAGNLYLLDKKGRLSGGQGGIWQYPATETGFGARRGWLKSETTPDFSNAVSMAIDGSIWILKAEGTVWKFTRGKKDAFGIAGLPAGKEGPDKPFSSPSLIYTDDDCENLYLLDKGNSRVVVLAKSGEYEASYLWEGIRDVVGLLVSEEEKKIWLLKGSKVYEIEMR